MSLLGSLWLQLLLISQRTDVQCTFPVFNFALDFELEFVAAVVETSEEEACTSGVVFLAGSLILACLELAVIAEGIGAGSVFVATVDVVFEGAEVEVAKLEVSATAASGIAADENNLFWGWLEAVVATSC